MGQVELRSSYRILGNCIQSLLIENKSVFIQAELQMLMMVCVTLEFLYFI